MLNTLSAITFNQSSSDTDEDQQNIISRPEFDILDTIIEGIEKIKNSDKLEIIGCYALNKQLPCEYNRLTKDIDLSIMTKDVWENLVESLPNILNETQDRYVFTISRRRGYSKNPNSDSVSFEVYDNVENIAYTDIKIDMNVKNLSYPAISIGKLNYASLYTMLSDKLYVASTRKIYRRVKDFYDIYRVCSCTDADYEKLTEAFCNKYKIDPGTEFEFYKEDYRQNLKHAYEKNTTFNNLEPFDNIYKPTLNFIKQFYEYIGGDV